jgi:hypothetical protein
VNYELAHLLRAIVKPIVDIVHLLIVSEMALFQALLVPVVLLALVQGVVN